MSQILMPVSADSPLYPAGLHLTGQVIDFAGATIPPGWLACDGSAVSRTTFATLFAALGTTWGAGDGSTTFNVPDTRGRTCIGSGTGTGLTARTLGQQSIGEENHVLTVAELAAHTHTITDPGHTHTSSTGTTFITSSATVQVQSGAGAGNTQATIVAATTGITVNNNGSGTPHNVMQPSAVFTKLIKT